MSQERLRGIMTIWKNYCWVLTTFNAIALTLQPIRTMLQNVAIAVRIRPLNRGYGHYACHYTVRWQARLIWTGWENWRMPDPCYSIFFSESETYMAGWTKCLCCELAAMLKKHIKPRNLSWRCLQAVRYGFEGRNGKNRSHLIGDKTFARLAKWIQSLRHVNVSNWGF